MKKIDGWKFKYIFIVCFVVLLVLVIYLFLSTKNFNSKSENIKPTPTIVSKTAATTYPLQGKVSLVTGNCMPTIGGNNSCKHTFVSRNIFIRDSVRKNLVKKVIADNNGFYQVNLPLGTYSIFVEDNKKEYCNSFDGQGNACQIIIEPETNYYDIEINRAVW